LIHCAGCRLSAFGCRQEDGHRRYG
jgi:hypothetical protein